jgi:hypothetical protein
MTSPSVSNLDTITRSQHAALLILARTYGRERMHEWIALCAETSMGRATAECVVKKLLEQADAMVL